MSAAWRPPELPEGKLGRLLGVQLRAHRRRTLIAVWAAIASGVAIAIGPTLIRIAIDDGIRPGDRTVVIAAGVGYLALLLLGGVVDGIRAASMAGISQSFLHDLRVSAVDGLLHADLGDFESADRGDLQARMTSDVEALSGASEELLPTVVGLSTAIIGGIVAVALLSPILALVTLVVFPPAALAGRWLLRRSRVVYPEYFRRNASTVGCLVELVEGATTVTAHRAARRRVLVLQDRATAAAQQAMAATSMRNWFYSTLLVTQAAATAAVVVGAALLADRGAISIGAATAAVVALTGVFAPISLLLGRFDDVLTARTALRRVAELGQLVPASTFGVKHDPFPLQRSDHDARADGSCLTPNVAGAIALRGVSYGYGDGPDVVHSIDLSVDVDERVALVGATGSGKSTIARLAAGLATPRAGTAQLTGRAVLIPQESFMLDATIADNARLGAAMSTAADVELAVDRLGLRAWIESLPLGIDTPVGAGGSQLSLGERQLIALLRAIVADPAVLILDEATSVLDDETEALVAAALDVACAGRVALIVAHRPATAARCDRLVVLVDGRVADGV